MHETVLASGGLILSSNPFGRSGGSARSCRPLQKTLGEVIRQIGLETPVVVVPGSTGTGKTLLLKIAERICVGMGLAVQCIDRGEFVDIANEQRSDVLLVDEADSMSNAALHRLLFERDKCPATTTVLLCLPCSTQRLSSAGRVAVVELTRLSQSDARHYLQERAKQAGFHDLFAPAALDLIANRSRGMHRTLWSSASLAYFYAAWEGASQVTQDHAARACGSQISHSGALAAPAASAPRLQ